MSTENRVVTENVKEASQLLKQAQGVIDELKIDVNISGKNNVKLRQFGSQIAVSASGPINVTSAEPIEETDEAESIKEAKDLVLQSTSFLETLGLKPEIQLKGNIGIKDIGLEIGFMPGKCTGCSGVCTSCSGCSGTCQGLCGGCHGSPNTLSELEQLTQPADFAAFKEEIITDLLEQLRKRS